MSKPNGWQLRNRRMQRLEVVPATPTQWEQFCLVNRIDDPLTALQNGKRQIIKDWVHKHHDNAFVPELVLLELGMQSRWES